MQQNVAAIITLARILVSASLCRQLLASLHALLPTCCKHLCCCCRPCRAIGGLVELYLFLGPTPEAVIRQYHELVGKTAMQPYWALGAHQVGWEHISKKKAMMHGTAKHAAVLQC